MMNEANYFATYWRAVSRLLKCNPKHKTSAIRIGSCTAPAIDGVAVVGELMTAMHGDRWNHPASISAGNWAWRGALSDHSLLSREVALERAVIVLGGAADWTYQMSTASGLHGPSSGKRHAIDLVRRQGARHYSFIELKVGSDHPLYAAFEVLGYGLAYLHARRNGQHGTGMHDVMAAERLDLIVLGPQDWYTYATRGGSRNRFDFGALACAIETGVASVLRTQPQTFPEEMSFRFERFNNPTDMSAAAAEIVRRL